MPELQHADIVGNFLSSYGTAQAQQQAQKTNAFNQQRAMRQDERAEQSHEMEMDANQLGMALKRAEALNGILMQVNPADPMSLEKAKGDFVSMFGGDPKAVAGVTMDRVKALREETDLKAQEIRARIAATNRSNRGGGGGDGGAKAPAGYQWVRGPDGALQQAPIKGGPAEAQRQKMNDEQAKALGFAKRIGDANSILSDKGYEQSLLSGKENLAAGIPFVGNSLVSSSYQMADQSVRDFINAQLRRESGAVISPGEFDNARAQYIPVYGDQPEVLERKRLARQRALENLYVSSGPSNYGTAETVAQGLPGAPAPQAGTPSPAARIKYDASGNRVQ